MKKIKKIKKFLKREKFFKLLGGALFLASFIAQTFAYDYWESESRENYESNRDFSDMVRTGLIYNNLYFNVNTNNEFIDSISKIQYLKGAARKIRLGNEVSLSTSGLNTDTIEKVKKQLAIYEQEVSDYISYLNYNGKVNKLIDSYKNDIEQRIKDIQLTKEKWRKRFLWSYIIGSLLLLYGTYLEKTD